MYMSDLKKEQEKKATESQGQTLTITAPSYVPLLIGAGAIALVAWYCMKGDGKTESSLHRSRSHSGHSSDTAQVDDVSDSSSSSAESSDAQPNTGMPEPSNAVTFANAHTYVPPASQVSAPAPASGQVSNIPHPA